MEQKINAIILAGTKNCQPFVIENFAKFSVGKAQEYKQYLQLDGEYIVKYCIDAALHAKSIEHIFLICEPKKMKNVIKKYSEKERQRITLVENKNTMVESLVYCFSKYTQKAILLPSDAPFLQAKDIDTFASGIKSQTDYAIGFSDGTKLDEIFDSLALYINKEKLKYGLFPIRDGRVRINNLHFLDITKIRKEELELVQNIFNSRWLLDKDGRKNRKNWRNIFIALLRYLQQKKYNPITFLGIVLTSVYAIFFFLAYKTRGSKFSRWYAYPLTNNIIENILWFLTGCRMNCQIILSNTLAPMLDIDVPEAYLLLAKNNNFRDIKRIIDEIDKAR